MNFEPLFIPELQTLAKALLIKGDELRLIGGCVRDCLLNRPFLDLDLACKHTPNQIIALLTQNNINFTAHAAKYGTIGAIVEDKIFEITTLRRDVKTYGRAAKVEFVDDFKQDAARRDFTINALSVDFNRKFYDYFGGLHDLQNKQVKFIGDPEERIQEDYLRILRFFRFTCYYGSEIDQAGLRAAVRFKDQLNHLSSYRLRHEIVKIITCPDPERLLFTLTALQTNSILFTGFDLSYLKALLALEEELAQPFSYLSRFAALILSKKEQLLKIIKNFNFSNQETKYITLLLKPPFKATLSLTASYILNLLYEYDRRLIFSSLALQYIQEITLANKPLDPQELLKIKSLVLESPLPPFIVKGGDLLQAGVEPKKIGKLLKAGRLYWIERNFLPTFSEIIEFIKSSTKN